MFWNNEFLDSSPSHIDVLLQMKTVKLSEILFEEDLLQELKTSNNNLINFLTGPEIIAELVDNITQLKDRDCWDKSLYSRIHAAYISCEILTSGPCEVFAALMNYPESLSKIISCLIIRSEEHGTTDKTSETMKKIVPQKATLVSKLISTIHSFATANLSCHITQDISSFSELVDLLIHNIDTSGAFEILSTLIKRTTPPELRYVFCEVLSKLNFVFSLIDVMTLSDIEDKQRNACQLLCDIIVIGRQEASEQTDSGPLAQDMLAELLESTQAIHLILEQMFSEDMRNSTATVCGIKVLQTLLEQKPNGQPTDIQILMKTIGETQNEIEKHLIKFHELLLNPPKQEPIKTTFGIIQKPLGYMRLEVVNLIKVLIGTNSPNIIKKLVDLNTMKIIVDLFIEYSWNNLLHTQVEQALCLIINNCRHDEETEYQLGDCSDETFTRKEPKQQPSQSSESEQQEGEPVEPETERPSPPTGPEQLHNHQQGPDQQQSQNSESHVVTEDVPTEPQQVLDQQSTIQTQEQQELQQQPRQEQSVPEVPSRALLSQLLNECDLIGRLLMPSSTSSSTSNNISTSTQNSTNTINTNNNNDSGNISDLTVNNNNNINNNNNNDNNNINNDINHEDTNNVNITNKVNATDLERLRRRNGEQANFGHIIQMINSIAINRDLDTIRAHLNEMRDKRPELYDKWTTFVTVDVASFKEISLYYDAQSANNNISHRYTQNHQSPFNLQIRPNASNSQPPSDSVNYPNGNGDDQYLAYFSFTRETVIPTINVDVLPRLRRPKNVQ